MRLGWKTLVLLLGGYLVLAVVLVGEGAVLRTISTEQASHRVAFGAGADVAASEAERSFRRRFVDSGIMLQTLTPFVPTEADKSQAGPIDVTRIPIYGWVEQRIRTAWTVIYQAMIRVEYAQLWLVLALLVMVPAIFDGLMVRKIKQYSFAASSPVLHRLSAYALVATALSYVVWLFLPIAAPPWTLPVLIGGSALVVNRACAHFMKRV